LGGLIERGASAPAEHGACSQSRHPAGNGRANATSSAGNDGDASEKGSCGVQCLSLLV
jgi:hypothetical protein